MIDGEIPEGQYNISGLHVAFASGNNRSCDTFLKYISKYDITVTKMFKDIFHELINLKNFSMMIR